MSDSDIELRLPRTVLLLVEYQMRTKQTSFTLTNKFYFDTELITLPTSDGVEYWTSEYEYRKKLRVRVLLLKNVLEYEYRKKVRVRVRVLLQV